MKKILVMAVAVISMMTFNANAQQVADNQAKKDCVKKECVDKEKCDRQIKDCKKGDIKDCKIGDIKDCKKGDIKDCKKGDIKDCKKGDAKKCKKGEGKMKRQSMFSNLNLTDAQKAQLKELKGRDFKCEARQQHLAEIKKILTDAQYTQFLENYFIQGKAAKGHKMGKGRMAVKGMKGHKGFRGMKGSSSASQGEAAGK